MDRGKFLKLASIVFAFVLIQSIAFTESTDDLLKAANLYHQEGRHSDAIDAYQSLLDQEPGNKEAKSGIKKCQKEIDKEASALYKSGYKAYRNKDYEASASLFEQTLELNPDHSKAQKYLQKSNEMIMGSQVDEEVMEETEAHGVHIEKFEEARAFYLEGKDLYYQGEYLKAKEKFQECLTLNPYYIPAQRYVRSIVNKEWRLTNTKADLAEMDKMIDVVEGWIPPSKKKVVDSPEQTWKEEKPISDARLQLEEQTKQIIPAINFNNAHLSDVIKYLSGITGINIVIDESVFAQPEPEEETVYEEDVVDESEEATLEENTEVEEVAPQEPQASINDRVTISLKNIPLIEALKYILRAKGLKYVIEDYAVVITAADYVPPEELETRYYHLSSGIGSFTSFDLGSGFDEESAGDEEGAQDVETITIKDILEDSGVPWPNGSKIFLDQRTGTLIARNTPTNLAIVEDILRTLDVTPYQVSITARFVEIVREDISSFGMEYFLDDDLKYFRHSEFANGFVPLDALERVQVNKGFTPTNNFRFLRGDNLTYEQTTNQNPANTFNSGILSVSGILTEPEFTVVLHALQQGGNANMLSSPQITTVNGQRAQIEVVSEIIYPTEYDVIPPVVGDTNVLAGMAVPSAFETRDVGIILDVTPNVGADKKTINLTILPEVSELSDWIDYGVGPTSSTFTDVDGNIFAQTTGGIPINQPIFSSKNVSTSVIVNDGETVVLGGLITDEVIIRDDKIPFLGDIPLFGKLFFSHKSEINQKRNLLIFVTAELITPSGDPYTLEETTGDVL